jgi:hypothetical protein
MQKNKQENCMDELEWVPESDDTGNIYANLPRPQDMLSSARERGKKCSKTAKCAKLSETRLSCIYRSKTIPALALAMGLHLAGRCDVEGHC